MFIYRHDCCCVKGSCEHAARISWLTCNLILPSQVHRDKSGKEVSEAELRTAKEDERKRKEWYEEHTQHCCKVCRQRLHQTAGPDAGSGCQYTAYIMTASSETKIVIERQQKQADATSPQGSAGVGGWRQAAARCGGGTRGTRRAGRAALCPDQVLVAFSSAYLSKLAQSGCRPCSMLRLQHGHGACRRRCASAALGLLVLYSAAERSAEMDGTPRIGILTMTLLPLAPQGRPGQGCSAQGASALWGSDGAPGEEEAGGPAAGAGAACWRTEEVRCIAFHPAEPVSP